MRIGEESPAAQSAVEPAEAVPEGPVPRISRLMALAVRMEGLVREGRAKDFAELARWGGVSRARMTQVLNLRNLAPSIQERLLFLEEEAGALHERALRRVAQSVDWEEQQRRYVIDRSCSDAPVPWCERDAAGNTARPHLHLVGHCAVAAL